MFPACLGIVFFWLNATPRVQLLFHWVGFGLDQLTHKLIFRLLVACKLNKMKLESYWLFKKDSFNVQLYFRVVSAGYILLISICPMLKVGKLHSIASSAILANLLKNYFKGARIWWLFAQLYKNCIDCFGSLSSQHCE